ncbi:MAG: NAD-dependent DNA ligase LigA, partial [Clostridia bacterium]|nr:NAD-dependent DNA ligase LigA [Clostridia bacterium]
FVVASCILDYFRGNGADVVDKLLAAGVVPKEEKQEGLPLFDKKIVITGTLSRPRNDIVKIIEENGGVVQSAVSKKTDMLICGENAGSKLEKAKELNVKVLTEEEFFNGI